MRRIKRQGKLSAGFTLLESLVSIAILAIIGGAVVSAMTGMIKTQGTLQNRTEMHANVRNATELLAQEIGQAGRMPPLPAGITTTAAVGGLAAGTILQPTITAPIGVTDTTKMFVNEWLVIDAGTNAGKDLEERVQITALDAVSITATFAKAHNTGAPVRVEGDFATGVVAPTFTCGAGACGSDANHLKLYGDINGDGNLWYVEYECTPNAAGTGLLTRSATQVNAGGLPASLNQYQVLLDNVSTSPTPIKTACFDYQPNPLLVDTLTPSNTYVLDVAVTLTVKTQTRDPQTGQFQYETKALLNIAPRNVYEAYQAYALQGYSRVQPMPGTAPANANAPNIFGTLTMTPPAAY